MECAERWAVSVGSWSAAFHLFRINELYSSPDGSIQFIEIKEPTGSDFESYWQGQSLTSTQGSATRTFTFPANLPSTQTASRSVLIATPAFAAAAGVTPDFVVPALEPLGIALLVVLVALVTRAAGGRRRTTSSPTRFP